MPRVYPWLTCLAILAAGTYSYLRPSYNWDMFPYMALTLTSAERPFAEVHHLTYQQAKEEMPAKDFEAVANRQPLLRDDANAFEKILPYFTIKPGYLMVTRGLHSMGISALHATVIPSIISYCLIGFILIRWFNRYNFTMITFMMIVFFMFLPFMTTAARLSSPDLPAALFVIAGALLLAESRMYAGLLIAGISLVFRPDAALYVEVLIITACLTRALVWWAGLLFTLLLAALTLGILQGFSLIPDFLFTGPDYSSFWDSGTMWTNYLISLRNGFPSIYHSFLLITVALGGASLFIRWKKNQLHPDNFWSVITIGLILSCLVRYLMHPIIEDRFLIPVYVLMLVNLVESFHPYFGENRISTSD